MPVFNPYLPLDTYIPDGEPHVFGDRLYIFGSHDKEGGSFYCPLDYEVWSTPTDDLTAWRCDGTIYHASQDPSYNANGKCLQLYAPDVIQGPDGRYYLYYAMAGGSALMEPIHVAVCSTPNGEYEYYGCVHNPDGTVFDRGITSDPGVLNDNGRIWLYYGWAISAPNLRGLKGAKQKFIKKIMPLLERKLFAKTKEQLKREPNGIQGANAVELEKDMLTIKSEPRRIVPGLIDAKDTSFEGHAFFEASSIRKIADTYYFIYSDERFHELCYATSKSPDRDFIYQGVLVSSADLVRDDRLSKRQKEVTTNNHGSLVEVNGQWYIFYHRHTHKTPYSRQGCADKIKFMPDGTFEQAETTSCGLNPGPLPCDGKYPAPIACKICNGKYPALFLKPFPHVTHQDNERLVAEITNGTRLEYRYFKFDGPCSLTLKIRGKGKGTVSVIVGEKEVSSVSVVPNETWQGYTVKINETGIQSLKLDYAGKGMIELLELIFNKEK